MVLSVRWVQYLVPVFFILLYHFLHVMVSSNNLGKNMNTGNKWHHKTWFLLSRTEQDYQCSQTGILLGICPSCFLLGIRHSLKSHTADPTSNPSEQPLKFHCRDGRPHFYGFLRVIRKADLFIFTPTQCSYYLESTIPHMPNWLK